MGKKIPQTPDTIPTLNSCRTKGLHGNLPLSYSLSIRMTRRRIRISIPKLRAKKTIESQTQDIEHGGKNKKETKKKEEKKKKEKNTMRDRIRPRQLLPVKKVSSIVSSVFRHKKSVTGGTCDPKESTMKRSGKISDSVSGEVGKTFANGEVKSYKNLSKKRQSLQEIRRVPSRILNIGRRLKTIISTRKEREHTGREADRKYEAGEELCKKRILIGGKCKPLNLSGTLQYDRNGVLLPEVLP